MRMPWTNLEGPARLLVMCITVLLVSAGLCGLQLAIVSSDNGNPWIANLFILTGFVELVAMILSALVGIIALMVWLWRLLVKK